MSPILTWLYRTDHFQYINALTLLRIRQPDIPMVRRALQGTAASLEHLILSISPEMFLDELPVQLLDHDFDLSAHTQLKSLVLHNVVVDFLGPWFKGEPLYLHSVIPIILRMTSPNLERVTINLHGYREREHYRWLNWAQLDTFLGSRTRFPRLDSVVFGVYFEYGYLSSQASSDPPGLKRSGAAEVGGPHDISWVLGKFNSRDSMCIMYTSVLIPKLSQGGLGLGTPERHTLGLYPIYWKILQNTRLQLLEALD
ncbi:hypothetical protein C8J57DRAFT_374916 [Mycena rebaudengoi]|nr:hypothetical protein C8J57DRAFT_374916 [Mycena rebaudengoi]